MPYLEASHWPYTWQERYVLGIHDGEDEIKGLRRIIRARVEVLAESCGVDEIINSFLAQTNAATTIVELEAIAHDLEQEILQWSDE